MFATLTDSPKPHAIWIRASSGADPIQLVGDLDDLADPVGAKVDNGLRARALEDQQLRILTWSVLGLIGIAVVIALIGIANTLGLSVLEHAMLRALGLTRRQLRRMLAAEAVLLSVVATLLGTVIGVGFAWVGYETFVRRALSDATMQVPGYHSASSSSSPPWPDYSPGSPGTPGRPGDSGRRAIPSTDALVNRLAGGC